LFFGLEDGKTIKVHEARAEDAQGEPGVVLEASAEGLRIGCGEGCLRLLTLQPPGKTPMSAGAFLNGHPLKAGDRLPVQTGDA
jgi:methionyl-tRNA formyltransferase